MAESSGSAIDARTTSDGRFAYLEAGPCGAPPLIFLHGVGGAARAWRAQLEAFGGRWRAMAWDMPGYGGSRPLPEVTIASLAQALADFLAALDVRRPVLVGHSIGGMIVQELLAMVPEAARAVVLAQTSPAFGRPDGEWQREFIAARLGPLDRGETMASLAPKLVAELVGDGADQSGMALARECMAAVPEASYRAMMKALIGFDRREALPRISLPCLVLAGEKDTNAPAQMMARMAERIPGAAYVCLPGAGHLAPLERPQAFNDALKVFLEHQVPAMERVAS